MSTERPASSAAKKQTSGSPEKAKLSISAKGMHDILPAEQPYWERISRVVRDASDYYNFGRIETPILEFAKLFEKGVGEETDLVEKEMYTLRTKGGDLLALRPEYTAAIMRAYFEHALSRIAQPQRLCYQGPVFRHESPQAGRQRQFTQFGFEIIGGSNDPLYDAQIILINQRILEDLKIKDIALRINSIGCRVCRPLYRKQLIAYYRNHEKDLCADCKRRLKTNPLRLLDCKQASCQKFKEQAPNILDKLCSPCSTHFRQVLEYCDELKIAYVLTPTLVRGLDYYNRTVFEFFATTPGADYGALAAGGRYDYLAEILGGRPTAAVGAASGIERLIAVTKAQQIALPVKTSKRVFVAHAGDLAKKRAMNIIEELRSHGIATVEALARESLAAQLKVANKEGLALAVIIGQKEIYEDSVIIRDLAGGLQETFPFNRMVEEIKRRMKS